MTVTGADGVSISVVVATYNGARFLGEQLASLSEQTAPPHEVVVADDGSTDATLSIVEAFAARASFPVRVVENQRLGIGGNFLAGAAAASGTHIAWCDHDDVWASTKLELCAAALRSSGADFVVHDSLAVTEDLQPTDARGMRRVRRRATREAFRGDFWFVPPGHATVFSRSLLDGIAVDRRPESHIHAGPWHHDELTWFLAVTRGRRAYLPTALTLYRTHADQNAGRPGAMSAARRIGMGSAGMRRRRELLEQWQPHLLPGLDARGRAEWERLRRVYGERADRYDLPVGARRVMATARAAARGDYLPRGLGGLGTRSLALDVVNLGRAA